MNVVETSRQDPRIFPEALDSLAKAVTPSRNHALELAVVIPTYNERGNVATIIQRLSQVLSNICHEIVIVDDDSPDGTFEAVREIAQRQSNVRLIRRIGRRGLASACLEGLMSTAAPYIAVMDGDLQHDETILPQMLARARQDNLDVVVATRNGEGGSMGEFSRARVRLSDLGKKLSRLVLHSAVSDPMSGFFLVDRRFADEVVYRTSGIGFKILVDLLGSARRPVRIAEIPFTFRTRQAGQSKLDLAVNLEYLYLVLDKLIGGRIPLRFVMYTLVGATGVILHLATLGLVYLGGYASFETSQLVATFLAMTLNFLLNNLFTYRDARLRGKHLVTGLLSFYLACSVGSAINLSVSNNLLHYGVPWLMSGLAGLTISSVWNYGVTNVTTWRRLKGR